jgi:hypothetical protein
MADNKVFKSLAQFVGVENKEYAGKNKIVIKYTSPNYQDPKKEWTVGKFEDELEPAIFDRVIGLTIGQTFCLHTQKNDAGFNELVDVTDAKDAPAKTSSSWKGKSKEYDDTGVSVGAAWGNAVQLITASKGYEFDKDKTMTEVVSLVNSIIELKGDQEKALRAKKAAEKPADKKEEAKPLSKLEQAKLKKQQETDGKKEAAPVVKDRQPELEDEEPNFENEGA